jgi:glycolate oxidase FAD binding subunit
MLNGEPSGYAVDGCVPAIVAAPRTLAELQATLSEAHKARLATIPIGGRQHLGYGNAPERFDIALSMQGMAEVVAYESADLTVTVQRGVTLAHLQSVLAERGQFLPLDPPCGAPATVGGVLAANAYGPLRHAYGTARDWLIGMRVVHADGTSSKSGGRVVKNVAGYDMHKLHVGALGTLGVIAEATFKLEPMPRVTQTTAIPFESPLAASLLLFAAQDAGLAVQSAELLSPPAAYAVLNDSRWALLLRIAGGDDAVARSMRDLRTLASQAGTTLTDRGDGVWPRWSEAFAPRSVALRIFVPSSQVASTVELLDRRLVGTSARCSATVGAGVVRCAVESAADGVVLSLIDRARDVASRAGGSVVVDAAPASVKRQIDVFGPTRPDFALMSQLKAEFDPDRVLAPGRFVGRL